MKRRKIVFLLIIFTLILFVNYVNGFNFKKTKSVYLEQKGRTFIQVANEFSVFDEYFFVVDTKAANIKIYDKNGKYIKAFGRKGVGPNEFLDPRSFVNLNGETIIYDGMQVKLFFYKRKNLKFTYDRAIQSGNRFICGMKYTGNNKILIEEVSINSVLSFFDLKTDSLKPLITSAEGFNVKSYKEFGEIFHKKLLMLSVYNFATKCGEDYFWVPAVDIKILKKNKKGEIKYFGKKTENYVRPIANNEMREAYKKKQRNKLLELSEKMSFVNGLFCIKGKIVLLYSSYNGKTEGRNLYYQLYDKSGKFIKEGLLLKTKADYDKDIKSFYGKKEGVLYILESYERDDDIDFKVSEFKVME
jgi:hypothetical protein